MYEYNPEWNRCEATKHRQSAVYLSSAITGYFKSVDVPQVVVGTDIKATIDFYAINPGALYWKTFLIAASPQISPYYMLLDATREIGQEGGRKKTYTIGKMPNRDVAISLFIFAHNDAAYDWDWYEFDDWMRGYPIAVTHLDSRYVFISPAPEPPPDGAYISGVITNVKPSKIPFGAPIDLTISFNAYCDSLYYQIRGWETMLVATLNGLSDSDDQFHYGRDGSRSGETLHLGTMPNRNLSGSLVLKGRGKAIPAQAWKELNRVNLIVSVTGITPPPTCAVDADCPTGYVCVNGVCVPVEEEEKKFPWVPVLIGGGVLIAVVGLVAAGKRD